jgi:hypothetical protein
MGAHFYCITIALALPTTFPFSRSMDSPAQTVLPIEREKGKGKGSGSVVSWKSQFANIGRIIRDVAAQLLCKPASGEPYTILIMSEPLLNIAKNINVYTFANGHMQC